MAGLSSSPRAYEEERGREEERSSSILPPSVISKPGDSCRGGNAGPIFKGSPMRGCLGDGRVAAQRSAKSIGRRSVRRPALIIGDLFPRIGKFW